MTLCRFHRLVAAPIALASLLFMQLAVAAYACPMLSRQTVSPPMRTAMSDCHGMDKQSPSLCAAQSDTGKQSLDKPATPQVEPFVAGTMVFEVAAIEPLTPAGQVPLPAGYSVAWPGQFEYLERAGARLVAVVPATLAIIFLLLYLTFRRFDEAALVMATLPFALAGVSAEFGVIMLLYLKQAWARTGEQSEAGLLAAILDGALRRVRPKAMTVAVIVAGLVPVMVGSGTGSEAMQRIAAPMVGGMITAPLLSMFVVPAAFLLLRRRKLRRNGGRPL